MRTTSQGTSYQRLYTWRVKLDQAFSIPGRKRVKVEVKVNMKVRVKMKVKVRVKMKVKMMVKKKDKVKVKVRVRVRVRVEVKVKASEGEGEGEDQGESKSDTYAHRQVICDVMTPPIRGPNPLPMATAKPMNPLYLPRCLRVVTSLAMIWTKAVLSPSQSVSQIRTQQLSPAVELIT